MSLPPVFRLPREVLERIADNVDISTRLTLCRISRIFYWCTIPSVYRIISLTSPSKVVACCRTLVHTRSAALSVRHFMIRYIPLIQPITHFFASYYALIQRALVCMPHIQELKLLVPDPTFIRLLGQAYFHSISHFECYLPLTDAFVSFLNRHPTIVYLQIASTDNSAETLGPVLPRIVLPKLQYFIGDSRCVPALVPDASLRAAFLVWETANGTPLETFKSLEQSSGATINLVSCRRSGWNLDLIDLISIWLPDIYVLIITNLLVSSLRPSDSYLNAVASKLSRFTSLRHIHLHCVATPDVDVTSSNLDEDFGTVTLWGTACPSLVQCILPYSNGMKWVRYRKYDLWIPDASDPQGSDWMWRMLHANKHTSWNRLHDTIIQRSGQTTTVADTKHLIETISTLQSLIELDTY